MTQQKKKGRDIRYKEKKTLVKCIFFQLIIILNIKEKRREKREREERSKKK